MPDLRPGQLKRLGRIDEKNPERAERVAERMDKRASREERGKAIAEKAEEKRTGGISVGRGVARMYREPQEQRREAIRKISRPDTPLAATPDFD